MGEGPITLPCKTPYITETASTFQELYGTEEETDQVPQDCDIVFTDYQSRMTSEGERHSEARRPIESLLRPKDLVNIHNWNVRTMHMIGKSAQIAKEMQNFNLDILGISKCRWTESGKLKLASGESVIYSGREDGMHRSGVAIMMSKHAEASGPNSAKPITTQQRMYWVGKGKVANHGSALSRG